MLRAGIIFILWQSDTEAGADNLMTNANTKTILEANQETYDRLIVSIEAGIGSLQIFLAVCDGDDQKAEIIRRYEQELYPRIQSYHVYLDPQEPSLRQTVADAISSFENTIVTVLGAEALGFLEQDEPLKKFFGYLQWTREALRELHLPIILWIPTRIMKLVAQKSPDFWSWCNGIFKFQIESKFVYNQALQNECRVLQSHVKQKINVVDYLKKAMSIEINATEKLQLERRIELEWNELEELADRLDKIEIALQGRTNMTSELNFNQGDY
jgi:hypothetical protein